MKELEHIQSRLNKRYIQKYTDYSYVYNENYGTDSELPIYYAHNWEQALQDVQFLLNYIEKLGGRNNAYL